MESSQELKIGKSVRTVKVKMRDTKPNNKDDLKAIIKVTWLSITQQQKHRLIPTTQRYRNSCKTGKYVSKMFSS